jgi:hypothetical protein
MFNRQLAIISQTPAAKPGPVAAAVAAIQKQVSRDLIPAWPMTAVVSYFPAINDMPDGYWPVVIRDTTGLAAPGAHVSRDGQVPFAVVAYRPEDWTVVLSHEVLEMLVDPFGTEFVLGPAPDGSVQIVQYLAEICDPCQGAEPDVTFAYAIDGIAVSDFVFRSYYTTNETAQYSQTGNVRRPQELLPWGYFTWKDPATGDWSWRYATDTEVDTEVLGQIPPQPNLHLRGFIDRRLEQRLAAKGRQIARAKASMGGTLRAARANTARHYPSWLQSEIDACCH